MTNTSTSSYNDSNSDKNYAVAPIADVDPTPKTCTKKIWKDRLEALISIDDMIGQVGGALDGISGMMSKTVLVFTSDNGFYNGEHRLHEKIGPYEEGLRVPLTIGTPVCPRASRCPLPATSWC